MLKHSLRFEWRYHTRQVSFFAAAALLFLMGFAITATRFGPDNVAVNSSFLVMEAMGLLSLFTLFAVAVFTSNAVLRDVEHRMLEIVYSTPVGRFPYLFGRFAGAVLAAMSVATLSALGMLVATFLPWIEPERLHSFNLIPYLWSLLVVMLPNVVFSVALLFAIAALTRSAVATYVGAVLTYLLYLAVAALTNSPLMAASKPRAGGTMLVALLDPFALSSFFELTRYWSIAEKNDRFVPLAGSLLANRLLWLAAAAAIFALVHRLFSFRVLRKSRRVRTLPPVSNGEPAERAIPRVNVRPRWISSYVSTARVEWRALVWNLPFLLMLILFMVLAGTEARSDVFNGEFGTRNYPATTLILRSIGQPISIFGSILLVYLAAELFWRDQRYRMASIVSATPIPGSAVIAAKWTALGGMIGAVIASAIATGVLLQLMAGYTNFEPLLYLSLFYFCGLPLLLLGAAVMAIHAVSPGKYAGMIFVVLFLVLRRAGDAVGLDHPLLQFAAAPPIEATDMNGFGPNLTAFHTLMLHWSLLSLLLLLAASGMWRGVSRTLRERLGLFMRRSTTQQRLIAAVLSVLSLLSGGWIFYNTNVLNTYTTAEESNDWRASYERAYRRLVAMPQPTTTDIDVAIDFFPAERRYHVDGEDRLVNRTGSPIESIWVAVRRDAGHVKLSIDGARLRQKDERFGMFRFDLDPPLAPGRTTRFHYELTFHRKGFEAGEQNEPILSNGTFLIGFRVFPSIGYRKTFELQDARERAKRGLPPRDATPEETDALEIHSAPRVNVTATLSTSGDQTAISGGTLVRSWRSGDRRYFRYRTDSPIANAPAFGSGRWKVATRRAGNASLELYYHPEHHQNAARMLDAATKSIETFEASFGPYPHRQLRLAEIVLQPFGGYASPGVIWYVERRAFLTDTRDPNRLDMVTRRTVHEVAHQWWGHQLSPSAGPGASFLVETLAKHSESMIIERMHGREHLDRFLEMELDRYLVGRSRQAGNEDPLLRVDSQPYIYYAKGALVMNAISREIGEEALNRALRGLLRQPHPAAPDVLPRLRAVSPPESYAQIEEWLTKIVLYDFRIDSATARRRPDGRYDLRLQVEARKSHADARGNERLVTLREMVEVGLTDERGATIHTRKVLLRNGPQKVALVVDQIPFSVTIDPHVTRTEKTRSDNTRRIAGR